jgi:cyclophilin family peptidyl-prolyl cis-trans isomerase
MPHWFRRSPRRCQPFRPLFEELEDRRLLSGSPSAPVLDPIAVSLNVPLTKTLIVPLSANDPTGGTVSYTVTSSNPNVQVVSHSVNTFLQLSVAGFGNLEFELLGDVAPTTAALIAGMARSEFYDGLTFHRVVPGFMIQGGDPAGNGSGGPGFQFNDEFNPQAIFSGSGQLAMANSGRDTNGSQFFITDGPQRFLDFNHTIFGQLVRGFDVLHRIESVPLTLQDPTNPHSEDSKPVTPIVITSARIVQDATDAVFTLVSTGTAADSTTLTITATSSNGGVITEQVTGQVVADVNSQGTAVNDPPILGPVSDQVSPTGGPVVIHLTRSDPENDASDYGAAVLQADTSNATVSQPAVNTSGSTDVTVTPTPGFTGAVHVIVGVREHGATSRGSSSYPWDTQVITVAFGDQPLTIGPAGPINATEGAAASLPLASFSDADASAAATDYQVSINWGDGTPLDTTTGKVSASNGQFLVTGNHTYHEAGTFPVHVVVTDVHKAPTAGADNGGATANLTVMATVADAALAGQGVAVAGTAGSVLNQVLVATFTDVDPNGKPGDFAARIDWGDGTVTTGIVAASGTGFQVLGSHTYATSGQYPVKVTLIDVNPANDFTAASLTTSDTADIVAPPLPVPVPQPPPVATPVPKKKRPRHHKPLNVRHPKVSHPHHTAPKTHK